MELTSKQRAQLRGLANTIDTIIHIGKDGIGENLVKQTDDALEARELIKGRVLENNIEYDARLAAQELAKATRSEVVHSSLASWIHPGRRPSPNEMATSYWARMSQMSSKCSYRNDSRS